MGKFPVNPFVLRGAKIVFIDINPKTMNIDENLIEDAITEKTKAILSVHYAGVACNMDRIMEIAKKYNLIVEGTLRTTEAPLKTARKRGIKTVLVYEPLTNGEYFETTTDFDYKMDTISVENLKRIGL